MCSVTMLRSFFAASGCQRETPIALTETNYFPEAFLNRILLAAFAASSNRIPGTQVAVSFDSSEARLC